MPPLGHRGQEAAEETADDVGPQESPKRARRSAGGYQRKAMYPARSDPNSARDSTLPASNGNDGPHRPMTLGVSPGRGCALRSRACRLGAGLVRAAQGRVRARPRAQGREGRRGKRLRRHEGDVAGYGAPGSGRPGVTGRAAGPASCPGLAAGARESGLNCASAYPSLPLLRRGSDDGGSLRREVRDHCRECLVRQRHLHGDFEPRRRAPTQRPTVSFAAAPEPTPPACRWYPRSSSRPGTESTSPRPEPRRGKVRAFRR